MNETAVSAEENTSEIVVPVTSATVLQKLKVLENDVPMQGHACPLTTAVFLKVVCCPVELETR